MILHFYALPWGRLLLFMPMVTVVYGFLRNWMEKYWMEQNVPKRRQLVLCVPLLLLWVGFILWMTIFHRASSDSADGIFYPLFSSYRYARIQPELYRANFMNVLLFYPGGILLFDVLRALSVKKQLVRCLALTILLAFLLSITIELVQLHYLLGMAEMDDVMHNTLGAAFGAGTAWAGPRICMKIKTAVKKYSRNC